MSFAKKELEQIRQDDERKKYHSQGHQVSSECPNNKFGRCMGDNYRGEPCLDPHDWKECSYLD